MWWWKFYGCSEGHPDVKGSLQVQFHICAYVLYDKSHLSLQTFQSLVIIFQLFLLCLGGFLRDNLSLKSPAFYLPPVREAGSVHSRSWK